MKKVLYILGLLDDEDIDWMVSAGTREQYQPGDVLVREGQRTQFLFVIVEGNVDITVRGKQIANVGIGEIVGEMSLLDFRPASATVTAGEDLTVLKISFEELEARLQSNFRFQGRFYKALGVFLAQRMRTINMKVAYGDEAPLIDEDDDELLDDEINDEVMEKLSLAGARFKVIIDKLKNG
ncbi:cyclic nucleotide-binding domain-containing protein [Hwanghaeella grinnelliae]|uniref:Cyclic nucleotide-binding domain-containing protein n=1 Tax=Hwanghaeella grinnelliae TaxID=2500179 RepID=A0A3S2VMP0_9PROT|nr:cyclic nucleotide-binding domain-containing protein [Hwanghaeella grinnelliae]RVU33963.1 cyclic nucleotide-binding domain-containing protein [Hwanghaeella grinnelliae]